MPSRKRIDLRRPAPYLEQKSVFLILHEPGPLGEYLAWMRRLLGHNHADLVAMDDGSPVEQVHQAIRLRDDERKKNAKYDEVWCAFTETTRGDCSDARALGTSQRVNVVTFNPSVELWFLLHFEAPSAADSQADIAAKLRKHLPGYVSSIRNQENKFFNKYDDARQRAITLGSGAELGVDVYRLVDAMRSSKQRFSGGDALPRL